MFCTLDLKTHLRIKLSAQTVSQFIHSYINKGLFGVIVKLLFGVIVKEVPTSHVFASNLKNAVKSYVYLIFS